MQRTTHNTGHTTTPPRFFVSTRGVLMDRQATGTARRCGYSIEANRATRSEMQILADLLNEPATMQRFDSGWSPDQAWTEAIDQLARQYRTFMPALILPERPSHAAV